MKKLMIAALLAVGLTSAFAQSAGPVTGEKAGAAQGKAGKSGPKMAKLTQELYAKLNLTVDQKKKIEDLDKSHAEKVKAARKENKGDKEGWKEKNKTFREEHEKALNAILTPDQQKQYKELRKDLMKKLRKERVEKKTTP
ncbi:hypothetical protein EON81_11405 [bacterium]|nr:MAG: hypothetical protein EON81_11405 [bacterium]